jgi:hypothetical protein
MWWYWAYKTYRWSDERIRGIILQKYTANNSDKLTEDTYFNAEDIRLFAELGKRYASTIVELRDKETQEPLEKYSVKYEVREDCQPFAADCIYL